MIASKEIAHGLYVFMSLFYHMILSNKPATFGDHVLERLPTRWTHQIDKEQLRFKELEHVGSKKPVNFFGTSSSAFGCRLLANVSMPNKLNSSKAIRTTLSRRK